MAKTRNKRRKDGRFQTKLYLGIENGKAIYKYIYANTEKELNIKLEQERGKFGKGIDLLAQRDTFGEFAEKWLKIKEAEVSGHRYYIYQCRVKNLSPISWLPIAKVRTMDIQYVIMDLSEQMSRATLKEVKSTARQILQMAVDNRIIDYNPADAVKLPKKAVESTTKRRALTAEEQSWIADTPHRMQTAAMIMMYAGLRRGEVVPLLWSDIDLEGGTIRVNKSMSRIKNDWVVKQGAKTDAGVRVVYIPDILINFLRSIERKSLIVCPDSKGKIMSLSAWNSLWDSYLKTLNLKYGDFSGIIVTGKNNEIKIFEKPKSIYAPIKVPMVIPKITPHWLRHTYITAMYLAGVDVLTAKEQAGHADIHTTMEIYTHLDAMHKVRQIDKLNKFFEASSK